MGTFRLLRFGWIHTHGLLDSGSTPRSVGRNIGSQALKKVVWRAEPSSKPFVVAVISAFRSAQFLSTCTLVHFLRLVQAQPIEGACPPSMMVGQFTQN